MTELSRFWEGNSTLGTGVGDRGPYTREQMAEVFKSVLGQRTGVLSGLKVTESTPNAKSVDVSAGSAIITGYFYGSDDTETVAISDNSSGNARIDVIVLECDWTAQTIRVSVVEGTPSGSPSAPALTQTEDTLYQIPLAQISVADSFSVITDTEITRNRVWARDNWPGRLEPSPLSAAPDGWLLCDGRAISRTTYADLFDMIGTTYGVGDGSTTFNIPDLRGQTIAGMDDMGTAEGAANEVANSAADSLGGSMGEENHTLTVSEMPSHSHTFPNLSGGNTNSTAGINIYENGGGTTSTSSQGSGAAHNNMQPTTFMNYIIKT